MPVDTPHPVPAPAAVLREQFRAVGLRLRLEALAVVAIVVVGLALAIWDFVTDLRTAGSLNTVTLHPGPIGFLPIVVAFFVPMSVWRREEPDSRSYLWALPVARRSGQLTKALAGWIWYVLATAAFFVFVLALSAAVFAADGPWRVEIADIAAWWWVLPFTTVTALYLLGSALAIASNHPWRWVLGFLAMLLVLVIMVEGWGSRTADHILDVLLNGRYGVVAILGVNGRLTFEDWLAATALWLGAGALGTWIAASVHREG